MEDCACCYEPVSNKLICGHYIHLKCICLSGKLECPICRTQLNENMFTAELLMVYDAKKIELKNYENNIDETLANDAINEVHLYESENANILLEDFLCRMMYGY